MVPDSSGEGPRIDPAVVPPDAHRADAGAAASAVLPIGPGVLLDDRFLLERELAGGGMSAVYVAHDRRHDRAVVVKIVAPELSEEVGADRFFHEIEIISKLAHPNILPLHDSGRLGSYLWYVAPFMDGGSLRDRLEQTPQLPVAEVVRLTQSVAMALEYAHARGIVHRDIKPENILFSGDVPVLSDFGIARDKRDGDTRRTQAGITVGTPRYMSPEQTAGDLADARSDVYSLGAMVFEMLTGDAPYTGDNPVHVMVAHARDPIPTLRDKREGINAQVEAVVRKALAKRPDDRFQSAREFADALAGAVTSTAVSVAPAEPRRLGRTVLAAVLVLATAATGWIVSRPDVPEGPPRLLVLPFEHLGPPDDRFIADGLSDEVTSRVAGLSGLTVVARNSALRFDPRTTDLADIARQAGVAYLVTATVRTDRAPDGSQRVRVTPHLIRADGQRELWSQPYDASFVPGELFRLQSSIAEQVATALGVEVMQPERGALAAQPTRVTEAYAAYLRGLALLSRRYEEGSAREAVTAFRAAALADTGFALAWARLAEAMVVYEYFYADKRPGWLGEAQDAIARAERLDARHPEVRLARGYVSWWGERDDTRASTVLRRLLAERPNNGEALVLLAQIERRRGRTSEAVLLLRRVAALDPRSPLIALDLGTLLLTTHDFDGALREIERSQGMAPDYALPAVMRGLLEWTRTGHPDSARRFVEPGPGRPPLREVLKWAYRYPTFPASVGGVIADSVLTLDAAADGLDPAKLLLAKAFVFRARGDSARARTMFDSAGRVLSPRLREAPNDPELHGLVGYALAGTGRSADAGREAETALALVPPQDQVQTVMIRSYRLDIAAMTADTATALAQAKALLAVPSQYSVAMLRHDPFFAPLRTHPGFESAMRAAARR